MLMRILSVGLIIVCLGVYFPVAQGAAPELVVLGDYVFPELQPILEEGINNYIRETGHRARFQHTTQLDEAILRSIALGEPADVLIVPRSEFQRYVQANFFQPLEPLMQDGDMEALEGHVPTETFVWGRIDNTLYCAYVPNHSTIRITRFVNDQPAYFCVSKGSRQPSATWELIKHILFVSDTTESDAKMVDNFMFKLITERDIRTIYHQVIHPDRKQEVTGDPSDWTEERFISSMNNYYFSIDPVYSVTSRGRRTTDALAYLGDPTGRKEYPPHEVYQHLYEISTGVEFRPEPGRYLTDEGVVVLLPSQVRGGRLGPSTQVSISVHKQGDGEYPRRYVFMSRLDRFEEFWREP